MYPPTIQKLIEIFSKFPTVGQRTATRFVFYLLKKEGKEIEELAQKILELKKKVKICHLCFKPFEGEGKICEICRDPARKRNLLCLVEKETDLETIEKTKKYQGLYFVLGGPIKKIKREELEKLRMKELEKRIREDQKIEEIILALNPTTEGEAIGLFLERRLKNFNKKITRLGRGLPTGGELEYADEETISFALENRR
jgi:recombination protein RecR